MRRLSFAVVTLAVLAGSAKADVTTYTDSAAFFAALGATPSVTETYEGPALDSTIAQGGALNGLMYNFSAPTLGGSQGIGRIDGLYNGFGLQSLAIFRDPTSPITGENPNESFFYPGESVTVTPQSGSLFAVGVFFNADPADTQAGDLFIQTSVGTAINGTNPVLGDGGPNPTMFFVGLISTTPFSSATIGSIAIAQPVDNRGFFNLDNLTITQQPVQVIPEPATLAVLGGLLMVGGAAFRRKTRVTTAA